MPKYRDRLQIIGDILSLLVDPKGKCKTHIMYQCNLSYTLTKTYLKALLEAQLITWKDKKCYITEKGQKFLSQYRTYVITRKVLQDSLMDLEKKETLLQKLLRG